MGPVSHEIRTDGDRVELLVDGEVASYAETHDRAGNRAITHTVTSDGFEGQGLAGELMKRVLDDIRADGLGLLPFCPYVQHFLEAHGEYADLVPADRRAEFGL